LRLRAVDLSEQLEKVGSDVTEQSTAFAAEKSELTSAKSSVIERLEQTQKDFKQQGVSLQTYSRDTVQDGNDASYVMRMQAQLCKAMHSLGITDHQMELTEKHADSDIKFHREKLATCTEERTATELELMNQLILKDNERREIEAVYTAQLDKIAKEREALERQIEENGGDEDDEDENNDEEEEEEDPEEKEAKEELMKLLTERRAEIERLEQLQEDQEDLIAELEDQVSYDDDRPSRTTSATTATTDRFSSNPDEDDDGEEEEEEDAEEEEEDDEEDDGNNEEDGDDEGDVVDNTDGDGHDDGEDGEQAGDEGGEPDGDDDDKSVEDDVGQQAGDDEGEDGDVDTNQNDDTAAEDEVIRRKEEE
jgi:hypothetical protein